MEIQVITIAVSCLKSSKEFYENILEFEPDIYYEPTRWQSYKCSGQTFFAVGEESGVLYRKSNVDEIDFHLIDVGSFWERIKDRVEIIAPLATTPWGSYKFVIKDPDGYLLGFVQKKS
jgi:catechol 2,3-dioxygenase-like lactoylglutathione lyase family enzyme